jgi:hypothetical protein
MNAAYVWIAAGGLIVAALTLLLMYQQNQSAKQDKANSDAEESGKTSVILAGINQKLDDINKKQERSDAKQEAYLERLVVVEQSTKSAHLRINGHDLQIESINQKLEEKS